jgi:hypothetical protein
MPEPVSKNIPHNRAGRLSDRFRLVRDLLHFAEKYPLIRFATAEVVAKVGRRRAVKYPSAVSILYKFSPSLTIVYTVRY